MVETVAIFDTNALPIGSDLTSPIWLSIFRLCSKSGIQACLPNIVVHESVNLRRDAYDEASSAFLRAFKRLSRIYEAPPVYIPDPNEVSESWEQELRSSFRILDMHGDDAAEALRREATRYPPARGGRGARDSVIWLTACRLAKEGTHVHLVSRNTKDFAGEDGSSLHSTLSLELDGISGTLHYHVGVDEFIEHVASPSAKPSLDAGDVLVAIIDELRESALQQLSAREGFAELSVEETASLQVTLESVAVLRAYAIDNDGLALIDAKGRVELKIESGELFADAAVTARAWIEYELKSMKPSAGEIYSLVIA